MCIRDSFETALAAQAALISFIPMLMDTGGNSGSQASVTIIRGLSLQEIRFNDMLRVLWKEAVSYTHLDVYKRQWLLF